MDPRTVELLKTLQADQHDAETLDRICQQFREQRRVLSAADDRATIDELCELLEGWADGATADLASVALHETAQAIEEDLEQPARAIVVLERVLDLEPTTDSLAQLARLYAHRNAEGDRGQAAELYSALGETLGDEGRPWLERALNLMPAHESALTALEALVPEGERPHALRDRWVAYLENGGETNAEAGSEAATAAERRRLELSRAYAAAGSFRDALVFISPLAERGHTEAARLQEAYLANLEGAVAPVKQGSKAGSLPPPKHARPARSGGTMVGFRLDQYHEALRKEQQGEGDDDDAEQEAERNAERNAEQAAQSAQPQIPVTPVPAKPEQSSMKKTQLGLGLTAPKPAGVMSAHDAVTALMPTALMGGHDAVTALMPTALMNPPKGESLLKTQLGLGITAAREADETSEDSVVRAMPRASAGEPSQVATTASGETAAPSDAAGDSNAPPARRSLPPPNPEIVRASQPAPGRSSGGGQAVATSVAASPRPQLHLAPRSAPAQAAPMIAAAAALPMAATELALPQPVALPQPAVVPAPASVPAPAFAAPELANIAPAAGLSEDLMARARKPQRALWPFAVGGIALIAIGAWAMLSKNKPEAPAASTAAEAVTAPAPVVAAPASAAAAAPAAPPASVATAVGTAAAPDTSAAAALPAATAQAIAPTTATTPEPAAAEPAKPEHKTVTGTVKALAKEAKIKGGKISATQVISALEDTLPKIEHCYEEALEDHPKVAGKATLTFAIMKNGKLATPKLGKSTLKNASLEKCTLEAIKGEHFAKVKKLAHVSLPLSFTVH